MEAKLTTFHYWIKQTQKNYNACFGMYYKPFQHSKDVEAELIRLYQKYLKTIR